MVVLFIGERTVKANTVQGAIDAALAAGFTHAHVYAAEVFLQADERKHGWFTDLVTRSFAKLHQVPA